MAYFHHFPILPLDRTSLGECDERASMCIAVDAGVQQKRSRSPNGCSKYASTALQIVDRCCCCFHRQRRGFSHIGNAEVRSSVKFRSKSGNSMKPISTPTCKKDRQEELCTILKMGGLELLQHWELSQCRINKLTMIARTKKNIRVRRRSALL